MKTFITIKLLNTLSIIMMLMLNVCVQGQTKDDIIISQTNFFLIFLKYNRMKSIKEIVWKIVAKKMCVCVFYFLNEMDR